MKSFLPNAVEVIASYVGMKRKISGSDWNQIHSVLQKLKPNDFGIDFTKPIRRHPYLMTVCENKRMALQLFVLPPLTNIPLHDHPYMQVRSRILLGEVKYESFTVLEKAEKYFRSLSCIKKKTENSPKRSKKNLILKKQATSLDFKERSLFGCKC